MDGSMVVTHPSIEAKEEAVNRGLHFFKITKGLVKSVHEQIVAMGLGSAGGESLTLISPNEFLEQESMKVKMKINDTGTLAKATVKNSRGANICCPGEKPGRDVIDSFARGAAHRYTLAFEYAWCKTGGSTSTYGITPQLMQSVAIPANDSFKAPWQAVVAGGQKSMSDFFSGDSIRPSVTFSPAEVRRFIDPPDVLHRRIGQLRLDDRGACRRLIFPRRCLFEPQATPKRTRGSTMKSGGVPKKKSKRTIVFDSDEEVSLSQEMAAAK